MKTIDGVENKIAIDASGNFAYPEWAKFCTPIINPFDNQKADANAKKILKMRYERERQTKRKAST